MKKLLLTAALLPIGGMAAAQCAPDYTDVTLNVSTQNGPAIASALAAAAEVWEAKTCGEVNVIEFPFGRTLSEIPHRHVPADAATST